MGMGSRNDVGAGGVDLRVNRGGRAVDPVLPFHDFAVIIHQDEIGSANLSEVHAKRIDPEMTEVFGVAGGDVSGNAFVESEAREQAESARQSLLAMTTFFFHGGKLRRSGNVERV